MSIKYEFVSEVTDNTITIPQEVMGRMKSKGISKVKISISTFFSKDGELAKKGISYELIEEIARVQKYDQDIAMEYLNSEGIVKDADLIDRLINISKK